MRRSKEAKRDKHTKLAISTYKYDKNCALHIRYRNNICHLSLENHSIKEQNERRNEMK